MKFQRKITPFLWLDHQAEEAARFYVSLFPRSEIKAVTRWGPGGPAPQGSVMLVTFLLDGMELIAFNGGPHFRLNEAFSLFVNAESQAEIDALWAALTAEGGAPSQCGWLRDRFGVSWQIIPDILPDLLEGSDPKKSSAAMQAMLAMGKLGIRTLRAAYDQA